MHLRLPISTALVALGIAQSLSAMAAGTPPSILNAEFLPGNDTIVVHLSAPMEKGYIRYERKGSGNGYDFTSLQYRADGITQIFITNIQKEFKQSGTTGKQTILLKPCLEQSVTVSTENCGPGFGVYLTLGGITAFTDVPASHPHATAIQYVQEQGMVSGFPDGTFHPDNAINRAEFTKIITLALYGQDMIDMCGTIYPFPDVPRDAWYQKNICRARDSWLLTGYPDGTFRPGQSINFSEAAKIIANGFGLIQRTDHCNGKLCPDVNTAEHPWYEQYVQALADRHAIPSAISSFAQPITRGEMAEMIYRLKAGVTTEQSPTYGELRT
jgi:hypothetical protein